jgi:hypothetical protein
MTPAFEKLQQQLKQLPGLGYRSAERIALHLLVEKPAQLTALVSALEAAARSVRRCERCGNLAEGDVCGICADERRDRSVVCVVEHVPDLVALERSGAWKSQPCAAASSSMPITLAAFSAICIRRRAPCAAIDTWSSWLAEVGIESTLAG